MSFGKASVRIGSSPGAGRRRYWSRGQFSFGLGAGVQCGPARALTQLKTSAPVPRRRGVELRVRAAPFWRRVANAWVRPFSIRGVPWYTLIVSRATRIHGPPGARAAT
jgi:hypothetical protein